MAVINDIKRLVSASRLFVDDASAAANAEKLYSVENLSENEEGGKGEKGRDRGKGRRRRGKGKGSEAKIGQGGTLDPLADGVLVVGVGRATKKLGEFLDCVKEYRTTCFLGCETDSYDSEGSQVRTAPWRHVTREKVEAALEQFRGEIFQTPPIFSALKMNGKPLYEYARSGTPLPRPIEKRKVTVHTLELLRWIPGSEHSYRFPEKKFSDADRAKLEAALKGVEIPADAQIKDEPEGVSDSQPEKKDEGQEGEESVHPGVPPAFVLSMRVSGGTYVRCIAHDLAHAVGSAGHVVTLTRSRQGRFCFPPSPPSSKSEVEDLPPIKTPFPSESNVESDSKGLEVGADETEKVCVPWEVLARALEDGGKEEPDAEGWREWERSVMERMEIVEAKIT